MSLPVQLFVNQLITQINQTTSLFFEPRETQHSLWVILIFLGCAALIALARLIQRNVFILLAKSTFLFQTTEDLSKDGESLSPIASILLIVQFYLAFSYFLVDKFVGLDSIEDWIVLAIVPGYFLYLFIINWLTSSLLNQSALFREIRNYSVVLFQGMGLLYIVLVFIDYFEHFIPEEKTMFMLLPVVILLIARFLRGSVLAWQNRVPWYYIILYFWTLEILPVLVAAKLLFPDWFREWIA